MRPCSEGHGAGVLCRRHHAHVFEIWRYQSTVTIAHIIALKAASGSFSSHKQFESSKVASSVSSMLASC